MRLTVLEIEDISRSVAGEYGGNLALGGVTANDGEADHAELLFTVTGCHDEPCLIMVNVPRSDRETMQRELRRTLGDALERHRQHG